MVLTLLSGLVGLATGRASSELGWDFPSFGCLAGEIVWKLSTLGLLAAAVWRYDRVRLSARVLGYVSAEATLPGETRRRARTAFLALAATVLAAGPLSLLGSGLGNGSSYGAVHRAGPVLLLAEVLVRYPLTAIAEESLFRGWLQPRLGTWGPIVSGLLWAVYHLQQWRTIPSLIPLGIGLGVIRWWAGNIRATTVIHYGSDVTFFLATYA